MIANGVPVAFDLVSVFALGGIVLAGYAALWAVPRILKLFT